MIDNSVASAYAWTKTSVSCYKNADKAESRHDLLQTFVENLKN